MEQKAELDVDGLITRLLEVKGYIELIYNRSKPGKLVNMTEQEIKDLCMKAKDIFASQPILLELEAPLKICGKLSFYLKVTCTGNIMIFCDCSNMENFLLNQSTSS